MTMQVRKQVMNAKPDGAGFCGWADRTRKARCWIVPVRVVNRHPCADGLECWKRDWAEPISGCNGLGILWFSYCFDPIQDGIIWSPEILKQPEKPVQDNVYFTSTATFPDTCEIFAANEGGTVVAISFSGESGRSSSRYHTTWK